MFCPECGEVAAPGPLDLGMAASGGGRSKRMSWARFTRLWGNSPATIDQVKGSRHGIWGSHKL